MPARTPVVGLTGDTGRERSRAAGGDSRGGQVEEIQRVRLLTGAVSAIDELGYAQTTVGHIACRSRVSRRTFYELFANREECLTAIVEEAVGMVVAELAVAGLDGLAWRERIRVGLAAILAFLDREPELARVCVVQALRGGPRVLERREELLASLATVVDEGRAVGSRGVECTRLTAEGLVGAAFAIVYARLLRGKREPLSDLLGELMAMIVLPYLGPAAARREHARPAPELRPGVGRMPAGIARAAENPLDGLRMRFTYRTIRVLDGVAQLGEQGCHPSNRMIADYAGIADAGQVSKLLARLERLGLLANTSGGHAKGEPNAWRLTAKGERLTQSFHAHAPRREAA